MTALYGVIDKLSVKYFLNDFDFLKISGVTKVFTEYELYKFNHIILTEINIKLINELIIKNNNIKITVIIDCAEEIQLCNLNLELLEKIRIFNLGGKSKFTTNIPYISKKYNLIVNNNIYNYTTISGNEITKIFLKTNFIPTNNYKDIFSIDNDSDYCQFLGGEIEIEHKTLDRIVIDSLYNESNINYKFNDIKIESYNYFCNLLDLDSSSHTEINVICYNPTYLFKDLCERFEKFGAVVSDYPLSNMKSYIWMRPQELSKYINGSNLTKKAKEKSIDSYIKNIPDIRIDEDYLIKNSVPIHHGTCYKPIIQFDDKLLNKSLYQTKRVIGVCEFEECYGENYEIANKNNFDFVPIGYDHKLFTEEKINKKIKKVKDKINIGFVGRAYGTNDKNLLSKSKLAHPKGYRKAGDILLNTALRLKLENVDFKITILGQNWDELTKEFDKYGIEYYYYAREKNIEYEEYPKVYSDFDILFIAARCEGGPVSAIEALSMGVNIVSTDVGVVQYLDKISKYCNVFEFDRKWHTVDYNTATTHIKNIYNKEINYQTRLDVRKDIAKFTTDNWVKSIIKFAEN